MAQRIRGQETIISVLVDGELDSNIDSIESAEFTHNFDLQESNFLGEGSPQFDQIFKGTSFSISGHLSNRGFLTLAQQIKLKSQRRVGGAVRIDISSIFNFGDEQYAILFEDCSFESIPISTGSREDFTSWTLAGSCSDGKEVS